MGQQQSIDINYVEVVLQRKCGTQEIDWENDEKVVHLLETNTESLITELSTEATVEQKAKEITEFFTEANSSKHTILLETMKNISQTLPEQLKMQLIGALQPNPSPPILESTPQPPPTSVPISTSLPSASPSLTGTPR